MDKLILVVDINIHGLNSNEVQDFLTNLQTRFAALKEELNNEVSIILLPCSDYTKPIHKVEIRALNPLLVTDNELMLEFNNTLTKINNALNKPK